MRAPGGADAGEGRPAEARGKPVGLWPYYRPGRWVPHCTVGFGLDQDQIPEAFRVLHGYQPIEATVTSVAVTDVMTGAEAVLAGR